ncbi:hypothetical protein ACHQM5_018557 [Ranunculus cassubicifolius]
MVLKARICELPDDILAFTLSFLPIREASRTSLLSCRWRHLWKDSMKFSSSLILDELSMTGSTYTNKGFCKEGSPLETEQCKFIGWVDQMLQMGYGPVIDSFRLRFTMTKDFAHHIDKWIKVAITKRAQRYDIDLSGFHTIRYVFDFPYENLYTFPDWLFTQESGPSVVSLHLKSCALGCLGFNCFSSLADLQLHSVFLDQDSLVKFLSDCPNIEKLALVNCWKLHRLSISGPSLKLKKMKIVKCRTLSYIEINARNLTRLEHCGGKVQFSFVDARALSNFVICARSEGQDDNDDFAINYAVTKLSSDLPQLQMLFLDGPAPQENMIPRQLPMFKNLKKLGMHVSGFREESLWGFIHLLHASPCLHMLELHLSTPDEYIKQKRPLDVAHLHLKEIVVSGFQGDSHEIELMRYLLSNCVALKKVTLDECNKIYDYIHSAMSSMKQYRRYTDKFKLAETKKLVQEQIVPFVPHGVEFLYIDGL